MTRARFILLSLASLAGPALAGPPVLQGATLFSIPSGGADYYGGMFTQVGGGSDGVTSVLREDSAQNLSIVQFTAGGSVSGKISLQDSGVQLHNDLGLAEDPSGNLVVSGRASGNSQDALAAAVYAPNGTLLWAATQNIGGNGSAGAGRPGIDSSGSVYVGGNSGGQNCGSRATMITKFSNGGAIWTTTLSTATYGDNTPSSIVADPAGGAYVLVMAQDCTSSSTVYLVKVASNGTVAFSRSLSHNGGQGAVGFGNGAVYVSSQVSGFTVWKIDPTTGNTLAQGGIGSLPFGFNSTSIITNPSGTVFVGGTEWNGTHNIPTLAAFLSDLSTTLWFVTDDHGLDEGGCNHSAIGTDASGNAYFATGTGGCGNSCSSAAVSDLVVHAFNASTGGVTWFKQYDGPITGPSAGITSLGNSTWMLTRAPLEIVKYDTSGGTPALVWTRSWTSAAYCSNNNGGGFGGSSAIAVGGSATQKIFIGIAVSSTATNTPAILVDRYDAGSGAFEAEYPAPVTYDVKGVTAVLSDAAEDVWIVIQSQTTTGKMSQIVRMDGTNGAIAWSRTFGVPNPNVDGATGCAVDPGTGNAYVTAPADDGFGGFAAAVSRFDGSGAIQWSVTVGAFGGLLYPTGLAWTTAGSGTVYVCGLTVDSLSAPNYWNGALLGLSPAGQLVYTRTSNGGGNQALYSGVTVDQSGAVLVSGYVSATVSLAGNGGPSGVGTADVLLQAYDPTDPCQAPMWTARWDSGQGDDYGSFMTTTVTGLVQLSVGTPTTGGLFKYTEGSPGAPALSGSAHPVPGPVDVGTLGYLTLTITNTGARTAQAVSATAIITSGAATFGKLMGPWPASVLSLPGGSATTFVWSYTPTGAGSAVWTASASGTDPCTGLSVGSGMWSTTTTAGYRAVLASALAVSRTIVGIGDVLTVSLTVTNTGNAASSATVSATVFAYGGPAQAVSVPSPWSAVLGGGVSHTFAWTFSVTASGWAGFTASVSGTDAVFSPPAALSTAGPVSSTVVNQARLTAVAMTSTWTTVSVGEWFPVAMTVSNTGGFTANNMSATIYVGPGSAKLVSWPGTLSLPPHGSTVFQWTFSATASGPITLTMSASATDSSTLGYPLLASATVGGTSQTPAALSVQFVIYGTTVEVGQKFLLTATITNTGQAACTSFALKVGDQGVSSSMTDGPTPQPPSTLAGGQVVFITATGYATAVGTVQFGFTGTGTDGNSGVAITTGPGVSNAVTVVGAAILNPSLAFTSTSLTGGQSSVVTLTVSNSGTANALAVTPTLTATGNNFVDQPTGPFPASASLAVGATKIFTWTITGRKFGTAALTVSITGTNQPDSHTLTAIQFGAIDVTSSLTSALAVAPSEVKVGDTFSVNFTVANGSLSAALQADPFLVSYDATVVELVSSPGSIAPFNGGTSTVFAWTFKALKEGPVSFTTSATADFAPPLDGTRATATVTIKPAEFVPSFAGESLIFPNPVAGDATAIAIRLTGDVSKITVDVYNTGFQRVWHGEWAGMTAGDHRLDLTGLSGWAPGLYLVKMVTEGDGKKTYKTIRLAVKR